MYGAIIKRTLCVWRYYKAYMICMVLL